MHILKSTSVWILRAMAVVVLGGCDQEPVPAYLAIDAYQLNVYANQGFHTHGITDCWVYVDEEIIGAFQMPFEIPILSDGEHTIRIRPGIKLNGLESQRTPHPFLEDLVTTTRFAPDSTTHIAPTTRYRTGITFGWIDTLDSVGISLAATSYSLHNIERPIDTVFGPTNKCVRIYMNPGELGYAECQSQSPFDFPKQGRTVLLEFDYRNNYSLTVGLFINDQGTVRDIPILILNATDTWKHVYVNLTENVSYYVNASSQQPFFRFTTNGEQTDVKEAFIDNIRVTF